MNLSSLSLTCPLQPCASEAHPVWVSAPRFENQSVWTLGLLAMCPFVTVGSESCPSLLVATPLEPS